MDEGTVTSPAEPVFEILESGSLEIRAGLAPAAITNLASGTELTVHPPDETDPLPATVSRILPSRDSLTRTIDVILKTTSSTLRPGDLVEIPITPTTNQPVFSEIRDRLADAAATFPPEVLPPVFDEKRRAVAYTYIAAVRWTDGTDDSLGILA